MIRLYNLLLDILILGFSKIYLSILSNNYLISKNDDLYKIRLYKL